MLSSLIGGFIGCVLGTVIGDWAVDRIRGR